MMLALIKSNFQPILVLPDALMHKPLLKPFKISLYLSGLPAAALLHYVLSNLSALEPIPKITPIVEHKMFFPQVPVTVASLNCCCFNLN